MINTPEINTAETNMAEINMAEINMAEINTVIFDLGQVLLRWDPRLAYRQVLGEGEIDDFMRQISFHEWNHRHDAGLDWEVGEGELITRMPEAREAIEAYRRYFDLAIPGMVPGTPAVLAELQAAGIRLLALTNWSADLFVPTRRRFGILERFEGIVVSGEEGLAKPDPALFRLLLDRYRVATAEAVFIDDSAVNCAAAEGVGLRALPFAGADRLRAQLVELGLLAERPVLSEPIFHLTERTRWLRAQRNGRYCWSTRGVSYEREGFVHCSLGDQLAGTRQQVYADVADADLVVCELDPGALSAPVIMEALHTEESFPHLYGELRPADVVATRSYAP